MKWRAGAFVLVPLYCVVSALDLRGHSGDNISLAQTDISVHASLQDGTAQAGGPFTPKSSSTVMERRVRRLLNQPHHHQGRGHSSHAPHAPQRESESGDDLEMEGLASFFVNPPAVVQGGSILRPGAGGAADVIEFGMYAKNFYGADLKTNSFRVDMVMTGKWKDIRSMKLVPEGVNRIVLSGKQAGAKIWQPEIVITNHDILQYEVISSSVQVYKSGEIVKVERSQVKISNSFELGGYPFDIQKFQVKIASSKYMANDVVLKPLESGKSNGLNKELLDGTNYYVIGWDTSVYEEADGDLVKSRGMLQIEVGRHLDKYTQDHLVPTSIVLMISWAVFYFPFAAPFITPRLVLSIMALLTFTNLMIKSSSLLPGAAPFNWNDLFNQMIQSLMFATIVINISSEICFHHFKVEELGRKINHEGKVLLPALSLLNIAMILGMGSHGWLSLWFATFLIQADVAAATGAYTYFTAKRFFVARREQKEIESARGKSARGDGAALGAAGADAGGDAGGDDGGGDGGGDGGC